MIYLTLFLTFLKIGAVSFGGGYGMISLVEEECLRHMWLTEESFMNLIAVAESTPGPIAVNMATFIGSTQGGIWGSLMATLGVVLPSFVIILLIVMILKKFMTYVTVKRFFTGVRPAVSGLIFGTALTMFLSVIFSVKKFGDLVSIDFRSILILVIIFGLWFFFKKFRKKEISPILLILISAGLGILFYMGAQLS